MQNSNSFDVIYFFMPVASANYAYPYYGYILAIIHIMILVIIASLIYLKTDRHLE